MADIQQKYQKLAQEYAKVSLISVLSQTNQLSQRSTTVA